MEWNWFIAFISSFLKEVVCGARKIYKKIPLPCGLLPLKRETKYLYLFVTMEIKFVKLSNDAIVPRQNTSTDAWYDLFSTEDYVLEVWERKLFKTNISCAIPEWFYGRIAPRSGLAYKYWIDVLAWVIDSGYRWDIWVILINFGESDFEIKKWDKIAQMIIEKCHYVNWIQVDDLDETDRNEWGFGSSWF